MARHTKIEKLIADAEVFNPSPEMGLTSAQVKQRRKNGLINKLVKRVTKSYIRIIYENVVNAWNILLFVIGLMMENIAASMVAGIIILCIYSYIILKP